MARIDSNQSSVQPPVWVETTDTVAGAVGIGTLARDIFLMARGRLKGPSAIGRAVMLATSLWQGTRYYDKLYSENPWEASQDRKLDQLSLTATACGIGFLLVTSAEAVVGVFASPTMLLGALSLGVDLLTLNHLHKAQKESPHEISEMQIALQTGFTLLNLLPFFHWDPNISRLSVQRTRLRNSEAGMMEVGARRDLPVVPRDRFEDIETVVRGENSHVHLSRDRDQEWGVVVIKEESPGVPRSRRMMRNESHLARQRLVHVASPHVVKIFGLSQLPDGRQALIMRKIEGQTLQAHLRRGGLFSAEDTIEIGAQICRGEEALLAQEILHGDMKPANVILAVSPGVSSRPDFRATVFDLGLSWVVKRAPKIARGHGTPGYLAPEMYSTVGGYELPLPDERSEVFSIAVTLYEITSRRRAFPEMIKASTPAGYVVRMDRYRTLPPPLEPFSLFGHQHEKRRVGALNTVLRKAMQFNPDDRQPSIRAFREELEAIGA